MSDHADRTEPNPPSLSPETDAQDDIQTDVNDALRRQLDLPDDNESEATEPPTEPLRDYGRFKTSRHIGTGGQGVVVLAQDPDSGDQVAVKTMLEAQAGDARIRKEFIKNAHHLQAMRHPNIMPVLEVDENEECPFMVMPFVEGGSLADKAKPGRPINLTRLLPVAIQIAEALEYAHDKRGVIHRDIKPENVLIERSGHAYLCDFGLVKTVFNDTIQPGQRPIGWTVGTRPYMAPEVVNGKAGDMRVDIYSFGAMLYQLATGRVPYTGNDTAEVFAKIKIGPPPPPQELNPELPDAWALIIETAMARDLDDRYAHISHLLADLQRIEKGEAPRGRDQKTAVPAKSSGRSRSAPKPTGRPASAGAASTGSTSSGGGGGGLKVALALIVLLAAIGGGGFFAWKAGLFDNKTGPIPEGHTGNDDDDTETEIPPAPPPESKDTPEESALALKEAIDNQDYSAVIKHGKDLGRHGVEREFLEEHGLVAPILQAAKRGDTQLFKALMEVKELRIFGIHDTDGLEPIHVAAANGHDGIIRILVENFNIPVDRPSALSGTTPLQEAMAAGKCGVIETLGELKADLDVQTGDSNKTALHRAVEGQQLACVTALLRAGADPNLADNRRRTPLHLAALAGDEGLVDQLLKFDADPEAKDQRGKTPADLAFDEGYDQLATKLGH